MRRSWVTMIAAVPPRLHLLADEGDDLIAEVRVQCFSDPATRVNLLRLGYTDESAVLPSAEQLVDRPPICWVWGKANRLLPYEVGKKQLDILKPEEVHLIEGRGYAVAWEDPDEINTIIERFLDRYPRSRVALREFADLAFP
jgi:pimeloyl-ACP methyl ester carboxylesterase